MADLPSIPPPPALRVASFVERTGAEGPGLRFALWVQGCPFRCRGCCNPDFLRDEGGTPAAPSVLAARALGAGVEGVSLLGGEPLAQAAGLAEFARLVREGGLSVMVYTGYTLAEARALGDPGVDALLSRTDLLVDGRYEASQRTEGRRWVGSENQVMHFLTDRYAPEDPRFSGPNTMEIHLTAGRVQLNGWPVRGAATGRSLLGGAR